MTDEVMAAMHRVGELPDGRTVFFASEGKFDNPGLLIWNGRDHDRFVPGPKKDGAALRVEIENAINRHSAENGSDTPDFILAGFLMDCLRAYDAATVQRTRWYGPADEKSDPDPGQGVLELTEAMQLRDEGRTEPREIGPDRSEEPLGFEDSSRPQVDRRVPPSPTARWDESNMTWVEPRPANPFAHGTRYKPDGFA